MKDEDLPSSFVLHFRPQLHTCSVANLRHSALKHPAAGWVGKHAGPAKDLEPPAWMCRRCRLEQAGRPIQSIKDQLQLAIERNERWRGLKKRATPCRWPAARGAIDQRCKHVDRWGQLRIILGEDPRQRAIELLRRPGAHICANQATGLLGANDLRVVRGKSGDLCAFVLRPCAAVA